MKITKGDLQALYPVSDTTLRRIGQTLSTLPDGKEKIVVKRKLSYAALLAAVLTLLAVGAVAAALNWDVMNFLYGRPVGSVEPLMDEVNAAATDGRVTVSIHSVVHDGRALAMDWTIENHQPDKPVHLEIASLRIGGKRVRPSAYSSLNCDWLRKGEEIRYGGDTLMLPEEAYGAESIDVAMTVAVYEPLLPAVVEETCDAARKAELEAQGYFAAMPEEGVRKTIAGKDMLCWHGYGGIPQSEWDQYTRTELKLNFTLNKSNACALQPLPMPESRDMGDFTLVCEEACRSPLGIYASVRSYPRENTQEAAQLLTNSNAFLITDAQGESLPLTKARKENPGFSSAYHASAKDDEGRWYNLCRTWYVGYEEASLPEKIAILHQQINQEGYVCEQTPLLIDLRTP